MIFAKQPVSQSVSLSLEKLAAVGRNPETVFDGRQLLQLTLPDSCSIL